MEEQQLPDTNVGNQKEDVKRGWYLDQVMAIGHLEADLTHTDEDIVNTYVDSEEVDSLEEIENLAQTLAVAREDGVNTYDLRASLCDDLFEAFPNADRKKICKVKHKAAAYILVAEVYHARGFDAKAEENLLRAGKALAVACSEAFGVERVACIRCLNDALHAEELKS